MSTYTVPKIGSATFEVSLHRENDQGYLVPLPIWVHSGGYFVEGIPGRRYTIDVRNCHPSTRIELVVSVDGIDIHDGQEGDERKSGLVVPGFQRWSFEGYRTSMSTVAAFRFCAPDGSYAALTDRPKNIGVIGVVGYDEKDVLLRPQQPTFYRYERYEKTFTGSMEKGGEARTQSLSTSPSSQSIGTQYGEERPSSVTSTTFVRRNTSPNARVAIRYETADVLERMGIPVHTSQYTAPESGPDPFPAGPHPFVPPPPSWKNYQENIF